MKLRVRRQGARGLEGMGGPAARPAARRLGGPGAASWRAVAALAAGASLIAVRPSAALEGGAPWADGRDPAALQAAARPVHRFDIPAGPLEDALLRFEAISGWKVDRPSAGVPGVDSPGVSGVFTDEQALLRLLEGTLITYRPAGRDAVVLEVRRTEAVEVTARVVGPASPKYSEPLRDIPQSITVIPRSVIEEQNAATLRDVLRNVPGITIQAGEGGVPAGDNLTIRGFSARTDIFIDGVRDFGGYSRDPYNLEQVEVAKGPASSYNGRGSTGGSVNLVSKTPTAAAARQISVGGGTEAYKRATIDLNQPIKSLPGAVFRMNGMFTDTEVSRRDAAEDRRFGLSPSLAFGLGTATRVNLLYSHLDQDNLPDYGIPWVPATAAGGPLDAYVGMAPPVGLANFYGLTTRDYEKTKTDVATAIFDHDFDPRLTLRNQFRYGRNDRDSVITAPRFASPASSTDYTLINRQLQSRDMTDTIVSNQTSLSSRFATGRAQHALVAGIEFTREDSTNYLRTGPPAPTADLFEPDMDAPYPGPVTRTGAVNEGRATTAGLYAFDTVTFNPKFELTAGLRYDHFGVDYESKDAAGLLAPLRRTDDLWSWRTGLVYKPKPNGSVYAGLGTSFNPSAEGLSLAAANVNLEPEKTRSFEVGTKWDLFAQRLSVTGALFRTKKTNARTPGANPGDPPTVLAGVQTVDGLELGAFGSFGRNATVFAGYAHMRSDIEASNTPGEVGHALAQTPENTFNLWVTYRLPFELSLGGGVQFMDSVYRNALNTLQAPSYWLLNATAAYPLNQKLTLRLNAYNLADEEYVDRVGGGHFVPGPGRHARLTLDFRF